jgi:hypothetical protein
MGKTSKKHFDGDEERASEQVGRRMKEKANAWNGLGWLERNFHDCCCTYT